MTAFGNFVAKKDKLLPLSVAITTVVLFLIFVLSHWLSYAFGTEDPERVSETMAVRELIKMQITPVEIKPVQITPVEQPPIVKPAAKSPAKLRSVNSRAAAAAPGALSRQNEIESLVQGFDMKKMITKESPSPRAPSKRRASVVAVSPDVTQLEAGVAPTGLLAAVFDPRPSTQLSKRGGGGAPSQGATVQVGTGRGEGRASGRGSGSGLGQGLGAALNGVPGGAGMGQRKPRGQGLGNGEGPRISLVGLSRGDGGEEGVSINDLIKWMKAHPGPIPKLVAYEMEHQSGDLSSAVTFRMNGRSYTLFLSCNENELLLRICLVEGNGYTMLKDNGIKENSNFLVTGDVIRQNGQIQSLISSRQAPGEVAMKFYRIFWSWWQSVEK
jgi:hypothetical protein